MIQEYLENAGLWDDFSKTRRFITKYLDNMPSVKYLYIVDYGGINAGQDMYLVDSEYESLIEMGYYEIREPEFDGKDLINLDNSVLSHSETWGWLYSNYAPIYDSNGNIVAIVGCDIELTDVVHSRHKLFAFMIGGIVLFTLIAIIFVLFIVNKSIIRPLEIISSKIQEFKPRPNMTRNDYTIMDYKSKRQNEITDISNNIKELELSIVDFMYNLNIKDRQINQLDELSMRDSLTSVGNVRAYKDASHRLNGDMEHSTFAILMADINNLKIINDTYGHKEGDKYISTCCKMLCETFKHSPVFRIGGDEFVVIVENEDYENRHMLYDQLNKTYSENFKNQTLPIIERYSMSLGMADKLETDTIADTVFKRADKMMYINKRKIKQN